MLFKGSHNLHFERMGRSADMHSASDDQLRGDYELVLGFLGGDAVAVQSLAEKLACIPRILQALNRRSGHPLADHDLEDLSQLVTVTVLSKIGDFRPISMLEAWVYRIAHFQWLNAVRRSWRRSEREQQLPLSPRLEDDPVPTDHLEVEMLEVALEELGAPAADIVRMKHYEDLTFTEIGEALATPSSTIKARYYKGLAWLQRRLSNQVDTGDRG